MKITSLFGSIRLDTNSDNYKSLEFSINTETQQLTFTYPYGDIDATTAHILSEIVNIVTNAHAGFCVKIDAYNKVMKLEEYRPQGDKEPNLAESGLGDSEAE